MAETTTEPVAGATEPAKKKPARGPTLERRTLRGLFWAGVSLWMILLFIHFGRPWLVRNGLPHHYAEDVGCAIKGAIAFAAMAASLWELVRSLRKRPPVDPRVVKWIGGVLAAVSVFSFFASDDLQHGPSQYHHDWEQFHYYVGSKYARELGYKRIYVCAAIAQSELGPAMREEVETRNLRSLETNLLERAAPVLEHPEDCKSHFSDDRWESFKNDIAFFRGDSSRGYWNDMNQDHGFNAPPVWTMTGHIFASLVSPSPTSLSALASLDIALFVGMFFAIWWAFGWRALVVALVFLGVQTPGNGVFTGGAFLRQDWLFFLVLSVCFTRKRRYALAGGALAWSALLRVFPVIFVAGWIVVAIAFRVRKKRFNPAHVRMFAGAAVTAVALVAASAVIVGPEAYPGFVKHIQLHNQTPLTNNMGLPQMITRSETGRVEFTRNNGHLDPFENYAKAFKQHAEERRPLRWALTGAALLFFVYVTWRIRTMWIAQCLGLLLVTSFLTLTCYYYTFFLLAPLLATALPRIERATLFLGGMSAWLILWPRISSYWDDRYFFQSALYIGFAVFLLVAFARPWGKPRKIAA